MATESVDKVVKALVDLAESMRVEDLARLSYAGKTFALDAEKLINDRKEKRLAFEIALNAYVGKLAMA